MILHDIYKRHVMRLAHERCPACIRGRPRTLGDSDALDGIFRILRTGMQWRELGGATSYATTHRRMSSWIAADVFRDAYRDTLRVYRKLCPTTHYAIDSSYVRNRFGQEALGRNHTDRGRKALKLSVIVDQHGVPFSVGLDPGNRPDVVLLETTIRRAVVDLASLPLFADRGYDSRRNRKICTDAGLRDRIFRRRTKSTRRANARRVVVEHTFAWLDRFRRLLFQYEQRTAAFEAFVFLALGHLVSRRLAGTSSVS